MKYQLKSYGKNLAQRLIEVLQESLPKDNIKTWWDGDPVLMPQSALPAIVVETTASAYEQESTETMINREDVTIKIVVSAKDFHGKTKNKQKVEEVASYDILKKIAEGRDKTNTSKLDAQSIVGILLTRLTLYEGGKQWLHNQSVSVQYGIIQRGEPQKEGRLYVAREAHVTTIMENSVDTPDQL